MKPNSKSKPARPKRARAAKQNAKGVREQRVGRGLRLALDCGGTVTLTPGTEPTPELMSALNKMFSAIKSQLEKQYSKPSTRVLNKPRSDK